jgi:hypothetical protein
MGPEASAGGPPDGPGARVLERATRTLGLPTLLFDPSISIIRHIETLIGSSHARELPYAVGTE